MAIDAAFNLGKGIGSWSNKQNLVNTPTANGSAGQGRWAMSNATTQRPSIHDTPLVSGIAPGTSIDVIIATAERESLRRQGDIHRAEYRSQTHLPWSFFMNVPGMGWCVCYTCRDHTWPERAEPDDPLRPVHSCMAICTQRNGPLIQKRLIAVDLFKLQFHSQGYRGNPRELTSEAFVCSKRNPYDTAGEVGDATPDHQS
jgi:hypothetical protein